MVPLNVADTSPLVVNVPFPPDKVPCVLMVMLLAMFTPESSIIRALLEPPGSENRVALPRALLVSNFKT